MAANVILICEVIEEYYFKCGAYLMTKLQGLIHGKICRHLQCYQDLLCLCLLSFLLSLAQCWNWFSTELKRHWEKSFVN